MTTTGFDCIAFAAAAIALLGIVQALGGWAAVHCFVARPRRPANALPPVSVLKPLHGGVPLLEQALTSICEQDYPCFQIVFGVQDPADPALAVVARLRAKFPALDMAVVVDPTRHGRNRKIGNLINMLPSAKHEVLVIADDDICAAPDYLRRVVAALGQPGVGLATTLYSGLAAADGVPARLGVGGITHLFLPGALLGRVMGRQDCLGATMALRRSTLDAVGGLEMLAPHIADDAVLGRLVRERGLQVALADTVPSTTVREQSLSALLRHELRWARTIRSLVPVQFACSAIQYPLAWSVIALLLSGGRDWTFALLIIAWLARAAAGRGIDKALGLAFVTPIWLVPLREAISVAVLIAAYAGNTVDWRGEVMQVAVPRPEG